MFPDRATGPELDPGGMVWLSPSEGTSGRAARNAANSPLVQSTELRLDMLADSSLGIGARDMSMKEDVTLSGEGALKEDRSPVVGAFP